MAYRVPPRVNVFSAFTSAVAGTDTAHVLIAAPGVGFALRISFASVSLKENFAANIVRFRPIIVATHLPWTVNLGNGTKASDQIVFPEPGFLVTVNTALSWDSTPSAAVAVSFTVVIGYYVDGLT